MHFFQVILASAFAVTAFAQDKLQFTKAPYNIQAGMTYALKWEGGDSSSPVTILLREGSNANLITVSTLTTTATGGTYEWTVPTTVADASDYAFQIIQGSQNNYWGQIAIAGGSGTLSVTSASATSSMSSASSRASSASSASASATSSMSSASSASMSSSASASSSSASASSSSASSSSSTASSSGSQTSNAAAPSDTGNAAMNLKSNAAFVLGAAAAIAYIA